MNQNGIINLPNSREAIQKRLSDGMIPLLAPILIIFARPVFALLSQGLTILIFTIANNPSPFNASLSWWTVYGTFIDIGCLVILIKLVQHEGIRLFDLISFDRRKLLTDTLLGFGICIVTFPITIFIGESLASYIVYGKITPDLPAGAFIRSLPFWAVLYSRLIWWIIWSFTEELTFQGYALPRLKQIFGHTWPAVLSVGFCWALQHSFLPLINIHHSIWLFIMFLPLTIALQLFYLRIRRLYPIIVAHWIMDLGSVIFLVTVSKV